ncbi:uncharacterized protein LOC122531673 [Frieseomelitta varia]|uniref:uncharacterized protein LOC122531673 n=1 Tax=Frieseomelitta varia TaxID=561572 RepID=UPI001CB684B3|nr:uncharacterized protein LOC122531673 [Frieseomelitta varia]
MTVREEDRKNMRHSSSWPDRAPQTVKVRVDPLSRAFTIIPTIRVESLHPTSLLDTDWIDEIIFLDHGGSTSVQTKRRFVGDTRRIEPYGRGELGETFELRALVPDVMNRSCGRTVAEDGERDEKGRKSESKLLSDLLSDETAVDPHRDGGDISETTKSNFCLADEERDSMPHRRRNGDTNKSNFELESSAGQNDNTQDESSRTNAEFKHEDPLPLETIVKIETPEHGRSVGKETYQSRRESIRRKTPTPQIEIVDYDDITRRTQHACPKCTSEGQLLERVDPFRSPVSSRKSMAGRCQDEEPETARKYSPAEVKTRNSWRRLRTSGLIGGAKNKEKERNARKRNGNPACSRPCNDVRKEATLRRHYYPEGGWGYVIVTCSALVHFLSIGLQLAAPGSWHLTAQLKFHQPALHSAGRISLFLGHAR